MTPDSAYRILVIDDDPGMRTSLEDLLTATGWTVQTISRADHALDTLRDFEADVILSDMRMPGMTGMDLLGSLPTEGAPPLVLISAHGDIPMAVQAMQAGAYSFVEKPYEPRRLLTILSHAAEQSRMRQANLRLRARLLSLSGLDRLLLGDSPEIRSLRDDITALTDISAPVLILGETGTGKDLVARAFHDLGADATGPYIAINCATLSAERFAVEMFGTADGAPGRLSLADGGTLFLDEVCACPPDVQTQLLRVVEDAEIWPLGATEPRRVRVRIIAATNEDVTDAMETGRLRPDLYHRLARQVLHTPTLRSRAGDLTLLFTRFTEDYARLYEVTPPPLTEGDIAALLSHDWPGNVRELRSVAERRVLSVRRGAAGSVATALAADRAEDDVPPTLREAVAAFERELVGRAITAHEGRMDAAAEALGIGRRTLNEKIVKLGLDKETLL